MVNVESLKQVESVEKSKLAAIEKELSIQQESLSKLQGKKEAEKKALEIDAKMAAEAEVKRMEAQKRLTDL